MDISEAVLRILFAALLGGVIGVEREYRDKSAGFRTMLLIAVGSAVFTVISFTIAADLRIVDPTRIMSYIVSGIGFIGAGVIIKDGMSVRGLTTASMIWLSAALGMGAGAGLFAISGYTALFVFAALIVIPPIEQWFDSVHEFRLYRIEVKKRKDIDKVAALFDQSSIEVFKSRRSLDEGNYWITIHANGSTKEHDRTTALLMDQSFVKSCK